MSSGADGLQQVGGSCDHAVVCQDARSVLVALWHNLFVDGRTVDEQVLPQGYQHRWLEIPVHDFCKDARSVAQDLGHEESKLFLANIAMPAEQVLCAEPDARPHMQRLFLRLRENAAGISQEAWPPAELLQ